ncbi:hypothetical protein ACFWPK_34255, partial [Nocardia sp. NPDC058519]|uniref:hypothetical protein n=1 Tax=Nocardia sp. NPDC058519 TaxID=3346535 RepID=UPI003660AD2E
FKGHAVTSLFPATTRSDLVRWSGRTPRYWTQPPEDAEQARQALGDPISSLLRHPTEYLAPHFDTLRDFYVEAAQRSMAVVTWWD